MPRPVQTRCPHCEESLTLKSRETLGKRIRCKFCERPFLAKPVRARQPEQYDDGGDDFYDAPPPPKKKSPSKKRKKKSKPSNTGKWIGISIGAVVGLIAIGLTTWLVWDQFGGDETTNNEFTTEPIADDGSPIYISNPQFVRHANGGIMLMFDSEIKDPQQSRGPFRVEFFAAAEDNNGESWKGYETISRDDLAGEKPARASLINSDRSTRGEVYIVSRGQRVSNVMKLRFPAKHEELPVDPEIAQAEAAAKSLVIQLSQPQQQEQFAQYWDVDFSITSGKSDPDQFAYSIVTEPTQELPQQQSVFAMMGKISRRSIYPSPEKVKEQNQKLKAQVHFTYVNKNIPFKVYIEARDKKSNAKFTISNTVMIDAS